MVDDWYRGVKPREDEYGAGVYAIAHDATGYCYVGAAVRFNRRWDRHIRDLDYGDHTCAPLQKIWDIEGPSALSFNILEFHHPGPGRWTDIKQILPLERRWIDHFRRLGCCYNCLEAPIEQPVAIAVTVPTTLKQALEEWASELKISRGQLLRTILRDAVKQRIPKK